MVSIIILSYNTKKYLHDCLTSLYAKLKDFDFEVIVLDNNSHDESVAMVKTDFKKVKLIQSEENLGFAKGINKASIEATGSYLLFLNSDTVVNDNTLRELETFLEKNPEVVAVGGKLKNADGSTSKSYGKFYNLSEVISMLFGKENKVDDAKGELKVDWISGGCMLIRKDIFEKLNGFDDHFFMYIEDMELCYRIAKMKKEVWYLPSVVVSHIGQGSSNRTFAIMHIFKGLLYFYKKHKPFWQYMMVKSLLIVKSITAIILGTISNNTYLSDTYRKALKVTL